MMYARGLHRSRLFCSDLELGTYCERPSALLRVELTPAHVFTHVKCAIQRFPSDRKNRVQISENRIEHKIKTTRPIFVRRVIKICES